MIDLMGEKSTEAFIEKIQYVNKINKKQKIMLIMLIFT